MSKENNSAQSRADSNTENGFLIEYYGNIEVYWLPELDGGGREVGQNFLPLVEHLFGRVGRLFDLCAGAGFIGFSLLAHNLCDSLILSDINPVAVQALRETVRRNGLEERVTVYHSDGLKNIPNDEQCDLVIVNPPCFPEPLILPGVNGLVTDDPGWAFHRACYGEIAHYLAPGGSVLMLETSMVSAPENFLAMIEAGGLQPLCPLWYNANRWSTIYYMWSKRALPGLFAGDPQPAPVRIDLRELPQNPVTLAAQLVHALRLRNCTGQSRSVQIVDDTGAELLGLMPPLRKVAPSAEVDVPKLVLRPGRYSICDATDDSTLACLRIPEPSDIDPFCVRDYQ